MKVNLVAWNMMVKDYNECVESKATNEDYELYEPLERVHEVLNVNEITEDMFDEFLNLVTQGICANNIYNQLNDPEDGVVELLCDLGSCVGCDGCFEMLFVGDIKLNIAKLAEEHGLDEGSIKYLEVHNVLKR